MIRPLHRSIPSCPDGKSPDRRNVLVVGASGMLGSAIYQALSMDPNYTCFGTLRSFRHLKYFTDKEREFLISDVFAEDTAGLIRAFSVSRPHVVVNCVGVIKQVPTVNNPFEVISINSLLPHSLAQLCDLVGARMIQFSTDCVFSGKKGMYRESDTADATDLYGRSKLLGEVDYGRAVTIRTSIIGHGLETNRSLVDWFLSQTDQVNGYRRAIFSGMPTVEIARIVKDFIIPQDQLIGLFHVSADRISKYDLLKLISDVYRRRIPIIPSEDVQIDRSLNSDRFRSASGFEPKPWLELVCEMLKDRERRQRLLQSSGLEL